ncbi:MULTISPECIES: hypothetical protein [Mesorhizobium]|uniref:hypothetical protein n=1 Tax=Mesorhizobium TaxID=68287 RepID=UPI0010A97503|nr:MULTISPECIES: hypothetical protein [Mesorhizobium]
MRVTSDSKSPDYWRWHFKNPIVFLDGQRVERACEADDEAGTVLVEVHDEHGPVIENEAFVRKTLTGKVQIVEARH